MVAVIDYVGNHLEEVKIYLSSLGFLLTVIGILVASRQFTLAREQYTRNLRWKESEFLAIETRRFFNDEINRVALSVLDWSERTVAFNDSGKRAEITVDRTILMTALSKNPMQFTKDQAKVRDIFDHFFTDLEVFEKFIKAKLVKESEVHSYFRYWFDILSGKNLKVLDHHYLNTIYGFLIEYKYDDVIVMLKRYNPEIQIEARVITSDIEVRDSSAGDRSR